jgi:hypothetical protein
MQQEAEGRVIIAFSSEVGPGSRQENASKRIAFSSEVGSGSRQENASKQKTPWFGFDGHGHDIVVMPVFAFLLIARDPTV